MCRKTAAPSNLNKSSAHTIGAGTFGMCPAPFDGAQGRLAQVNPRLSLGVRPSQSNSVGPGGPP